jgi:hypothetical protein
MVKNGIKRRNDRLYRKFWITCDRNDDKRFKIASTDRHRPNSEFKKIKYSMYAILVKEGGKGNGI